MGGTNALMFSMQADTVDYGEWKTGVRAEGGSYSILSFVRKIGQGVGGWAGGVIIGMYGYSKEAVTAADPATMEQIDQGIRIATGWFPAVLGLIAAAVLFFYPLTADAHRNLVAELSQRRTHKAPESGQGVNRFLWDLAHATPGTGADADAAITGDAEARTELVRQNMGELLGSVREAGGVVVGRDATVVLEPMQGAFHVRLEGPVEGRIRRAAETAGISREVAAARQAREDHLRTEMSRRLMQWTPSNHGHYDLVVDTGQTSLDEAVDQVVEGYRAKFPELG